MFVVVRFWHQVSAILRDPWVSALQSKILDIGSKALEGRAEAQVGRAMRIRIISLPRPVDIDGVRLDYFVVGNEYDVGSLLGGVLLVEGWAELVDEQSAPAIHPRAFDARTWANPPNLIREFFPPYYDAPPSLAVDRRRRPRRGAK
jgi:hypothetical protein